MIRSLGQNAAMLLGGYADPRTGQPMLDLEGAREMIDMLDVLREKTHGNLAPEEDSLLMDVLGNLKLAFMEMTKAAAAEAREGSDPALNRVSIEDSPCLQHLIPYLNLRCLVPALPWECRRSRAIARCAPRPIRTTSGMRPSMLLVHDGQTAVIDTTPDFRYQAMRVGIERLDAILFTHAHADHILGFDDIRPFNLRQKSALPVYASPETIAQAEDDNFLMFLRSRRRSARFRE